MTFADRLHFTINLLIVLFVSFYEHNILGKNVILSIITGVSIAIAASLLKEGLDELMKRIKSKIPKWLYAILKKLSLSGTGFDIHDLYVDLQGMFTGLLIYGIILITEVIL